MENEQTQRPVGHLTSYYHPKKDDLVIGIIDRKMLDDWLVDIGSSHCAYLPGLAFDGATKKNCPVFDRGELIIAFIEEVPEAGEVLLNCVARTPNEKLGRLSGGSILRLRPEDMNKVGSLQIAQLVSTKTSLTMAKGENGRMWLDTGKPISTIQLINSIKIALQSEDPSHTFEDELQKISF